MYLGPLRWPTRSVWAGAVCVTVAAVILGMLNVPLGPLVVGGTIVVLLIAAPRRVNESKREIEQLRKSRPD